MESTRNTLLQAASQYLRYGWRPIPLHNVIDEHGHCSCGDVAPHAVAKHPRVLKWQDAERVDELLVRSWWQKWPHANVGIATGKLSGFWVLDIDPKNGGDVSLTALEAQYGVLPDTYRVHTGSGGTHFYWHLPAGVTVTNSRGSLPSGIDVRGDGGQVAAPPSVSGIGPYWVDRDVELAEAPAWLLDMIQTAHRAHAASRATFELRDLGSWLPHELAAYVESCLSKEVDRALAAPVGERNATLNRAAFAIATFIPRGAISQERVEEAFWRVGEEIGLGPRETTAVVASAIRGGLNKPREPWPPLGNDHALLMEPPAAPATSSTLPFGPPTRLDESGGAPAPEPTPGAVRQPSGVPVEQVIVSADPWEQAVANEAWRERARREARRRLDEEERRGDLIDARPLREKLLKVNTLKKRPDPVPIVSGLLFQNTLAQLWGKFGSLKSFVALDIAAHVATGRSWCGRKTKQGKVLYMAAEGVDGLKKRVEGWEKTNDVEIGEDFDVIPAPVHVTDRVAWAELCQLVAEEEYRLIILDTRARITPGMNENDVEDAGKLVLAAEALKAASKDSCVLFVHHSGWDDSHSRGSSSVPAAMDTELKVEKIGKLPELQAKVSQYKQKDIEDTDVIVLDATVVDLGRMDEGGKPVTTLALSQADKEVVPVDETPLRFKDETYTQALTDMVAVMEDLAPAGFAGPGVTLTQLVSYLGPSPARHRAVKGDGHSRATVHRTLKKGVDYGWFAAGASASQYVVLPPEGRAEATRRWRAARALSHGHKSDVETTRE